MPEGLSGDSEKPREPLIARTGGRDIFCELPGDFVDGRSVGIIRISNQRLGPGDLVGANFGGGGEFPGQLRGGGEIGRGGGGRRSSGQVRRLALGKRRGAREIVILVYLHAVQVSDVRIQRLQHRRDQGELYDARLRRVVRSFAGARRDQVKPVCNQRVKLGANQHFQTKLLHPPAGRRKTDLVGKTMEK